MTWCCQHRVQHALIGNAGTFNGNFDHLSSKLGEIRIGLRRETKQLCLCGKTEHNGCEQDDWSVSIQKHFLSNLWVGLPALFKVPPQIRL
jgi:hypothetical protein